MHIHFAKTQKSNGVEQDCEGEDQDGEHEEK
jgi:hypothetical protein